MKEIIPYENFYRKESIDFFKDFVNPDVSVTCMVNAMKCYQRAKSLNEKFFQHYLHAILKAANEIEEFHYRFSRNRDIVRYDRIDVLTPIRLAGAKHFTSIRFNYTPDRKNFIKYMQKNIDSVKNGNSYGAEDDLEEFDIVLLSATPDLPFTSLSCTQRNKHGNDYPLINVGQMDSEGRMPLAISVNHSFVDGEHLSQFYHLVQKNLDSDY